MEVQYLQDVSKALFHRCPDPAATGQHGLMGPAAGGWRIKEGFPLWVVFRF